jgi:hypothetical protein
MSRRDLLTYLLIAVFGVGGAAVVSAVTMTAGPATPYLLWVGLSAVFISVIGLIVMLVSAPRPSLLMEPWSPGSRSVLLAPMWHT